MLLFALYGLSFSPLRSTTRRSIILSSPLIAEVFDNSWLDTARSQLQHSVLDLLPNEHPETDDPYAHWSFFDLAPPPIERRVSYDELLIEIKHYRIVSVQIAVQHDCVIATTIRGHRLACLIPDEEFETLIMDSVDKNGNIPFTILPMDKVRSWVRSTAQGYLNLAGILWILDCFNLLPWDTTVYNSLKERQDAIDNGVKPLKVNVLKSIKDYFTNSTNTTKL